jgi:molecular chaperone HscB
MDYFQFYNIPVSFTPDKNLVKKQFYALSKSYHPDFFVNESEHKQQEILEKSTLNNKAFQTLSNPDKVLAYILELKGELTEGEKYQLPQDFLLEMMEVNEALMELEFDANELQINEASDKVKMLEESINSELTIHIEAFATVDENQQGLILKQIKDIWYRKKYLLRIRESINKFATH